jgi:hypothetical protein
VLFAFDPRRCAILLIGDDKTENDRWYDVFVPMADALYDEHLETLKSEGKEQWQRISKNFKQECLAKRAFAAKKPPRK